MKKSYRKGLMQNGKKDSSFISPKLIKILKKIYLKKLMRKVWEIVNNYNFMQEVLIVYKYSKEIFKRAMILNIKIIIFYEIF
jgi:hypothetical protein